MHPNSRLAYLCIVSHTGGYDSDPMVYSCSTQYRIHTHGVFRGIQVCLSANSAFQLLNSLHVT